MNTIVRASSFILTATVIIGLVGSLREQTELAHIRLAMDLIGGVMAYFLPRMVCDLVCPLIATTNVDRKTNK